MGTEEQLSALMEKYTKLQAKNNRMKKLLRWFRNNVCELNFWINSEEEAIKLRNKIKRALKEK